MLWGSSVLKSYSKTQGTIAQSSAESELIAVVKAACEAIGTVSLADDLGIALRVKLHVDAAAALGILERQGVGRVRHLDIGVLWLQEQQLRRVVELTKVLGTSKPADLMTKHLGQELLNQYADMLQYEFRQGRSVATSRLHSAQLSTPSRTRSKIVEGERPEAKQWQCIRPGHWRSTSYGARAYRSPKAAGVQWSEVIRRTTRMLPDNSIIDDIHPQRDGIEEAAACTRIGGSKDIQTDVFTAETGEIAGDAQQRSPMNRGRTQAASPAVRQPIIRSYRQQKIAVANRQLFRDVSRDSSSNRASRVTFDTVVLAVEPVESETPGRLHAETIIYSVAHVDATIPIVRSRAGRLCSVRRRVRGSHSGAGFANKAIIACDDISFGESYIR